MTRLAECNTARFEWSHGRSPRGNGGWYFEAADGTVFVFTGMFSQARQAARRWFGQRGYASFEVCS